MNKKTALITGAASGIGLAVATTLARSGHSLMLVDRSESVHDIAVQLRDHSRLVRSRVLDVSVEAQVVQVCSAALEELQGCSILVNCAGISPKGNGGPISLEELTVEGWDKTHRVNMTGTMLFCRELIPRMSQEGYGRVVNIASRAGRMHVPAAGLDYHSSKAAIIGFTRALAGIYAKDGVVVNSVAPGRVDTPLSKLTRPDLLANALAQIPANRFASPEDIAAAIVFLTSPEAAYMTGCCLDVNGGIFMN
jgi:3-oxoacyl-[acyl-carrier protein] reductase